MYFILAVDGYEVTEGCRQQVGDGMVVRECYEAPTMMDLNDVGLQLLGVGNECLVDGDKVWSPCQFN